MRAIAVAPELKTGALRSRSALKTSATTVASRARTAGLLLLASTVWMSALLMPTVVTADAMAPAIDPTSAVMVGSWAPRMMLSLATPDRLPLLACKSVTRKSMVDCMLPPPSSSIPDSAARILP